ncbi:MMPL family transporter [Iocasia frigidifontis]|uniref:MMPL family transporter n=1 Tax=Iocasia fonsfrigidae TaxID=2682810 RepID=A0A8A7KJ34_9FIRM|nr:MMPL family transporter [Iocasia fonsfrigidae]QTL98847.1 MMPL family transporter [Iocasia fonsfrigidae]
MNLEKINTKFRALGKKIIKYRYLILIMFVLLLGFAFNGLKGIESDSSNDAWYFDDDPVIVLENRFERMFGNTDIFAVHVQLDDVFKKENLEKIRELTEELEDKVPLVDDIISITDFEYINGTDWGIDIGDLIPEEIPDNAKELAELKRRALAKKSLFNRLVSDDGKETWILGNLKKDPDNWRKNKDYLTYLQNKAKEYHELYKEFDLSKPVAPNYITGKVVNKIARQEKYKDLNPRTTGMPCINVDKRGFFAKETPRLMGLGLIISVILLGIFLRSWRGVIFPIITAIGTMIITLGIEGYFKTTVQPSILPMPLFLGLAVAVGYSIHLFNFFKKELLKTGKRKEAVVIAIEKTGWPLLFTALTTIFALMSFVFIKIKSLNWVGYTTAGIVAVTYLLILIVFPIFLSFGRDKKVTAKINNKKTSGLEEKLGNFGKWTLNNTKPIIIIFIVLTLVSVYGITKTEVDFDNERTMGRKIPYVDRMLSAGETKIGSLYSYDIGIEFEKDNIVKDPEFLQKLDIFIQEIEEFPLTKRTTSLLDTLKELNQVLNDGSLEYYKIPETGPMVAQTLLLYENAGGNEIDKWVDYNYKKLRIRVEISDYKQKEISDELQKIEQLGQEFFPEGKVFVSGSIAKYTDMMYKVSLGQVKAFLIAMLIIAVLMMIVFASVKVGLIGLIPNISPALAVGGVMGIFGIPFDMMTSVIIPMLMGLAVDDTIHFINHAKYEYQKRGDYVLSIEDTFRTVGKSLFMTSLILILNFTAYLTSIVKFYVHFGILAGVGILVALLADYFVTPICLNITKPFDEKYKNIDNESKDFS